MTTTTQTLANFACSLNQTPLPSEVIHHAKRAVIDWHAALIPGAVAAPSTLLEQALAEDLDRGQATLALGRASTTRTAALINGTAAHTVEFDDIYREAIYHPGAPTIAAAWAVGQETRSSGMEILLAVVAGYEISTRIGTAMGRAHYKYWHNTGTVGSFGAAASAASLYRLEAAPYAHALATVGTFAAGLQQAFRTDSMSKPLHAGRAAEAGVLAAQAARAGITGSLDIIEGEAGFGKSMSNGPDWEKAVATLGRVFNINSMTFKNYACCGHTFAPIDGALELQRRLGVKPGDITRVRVATYRPALEVAGYDDPQTPAEARFSVKYVVATALLYGSVRLSAFEDGRLADPAIRDLIKRIDLEVDPELDVKFPGQRAARITIETLDGRIEHYLQPTRKGDPEQPLSDADLDDKFLELASPVVGSGSAKSLLARLWSLDGQQHIRWA
jgi:2-methylcitrate dehydratase PrpD